MAADLVHVSRALARVFDDVEHRGEAVLSDLTHDSREVRPGVAYCAIRGMTVDGHDHAASAVAAGAPALLVERWLDMDVAQIRIPDTRRGLGPAAAAVHEHPSTDLTIVGITGTNGKTTSAYLVEAAFGAAGTGTGLVGTIESRVHGRPRPGVRTTPEGSDLQRLLADMRSAGVGAVAMEVSSHGLALHRVDGTRFAVAVFTNLSQDHLDFHRDMDDYLAAKASLFTPTFTARGVVCVDDRGGRHVAEVASVPVLTFGRTGGDVRITDVVPTLEGTRGVLRGGALDGATVRTRLVGAFNLTNAVGAVLAAVEAGVDADVAIAGVAAVPAVRGRLEAVPGDRHVFVDYAHSPDAITNVVDTVRGLATDDQRIVVVIGAGGDRDRTKRGPMGVAAAAADVVVVTSDNPRSEDPSVIAADVVDGVRAVPRDTRMVVELDRRRAIAAALELAGDDDIVLVLGKGHETTQEIGDRTLPFDDREVVRELLGGDA